jgi:hypothetical protein
MGRKSRAKKERREKAQRTNIESIATSLDYPDKKDMVMKASGKSEFDEQFERILGILGISSEEEADVNDENLDTYFDFLQKNIEMPCILTGIEDLGCFGWEEYYTFGPGNKKEYEQLKKQYPSYTDEYELISFSDEIDEEEGIHVHVRRISDKKKFTFPLADLEGTGKNSKNDQLLHDYAVWFVNYR